MQPVNRRSLKALCLASVPSARWLDDGERRVTLDRLEHGSALRCPAEALRGLSVLVLAETQLPAVLAAIELDGVARRIVLCLPDMAASHLPSVVAGAQVDVVVTDGTGPSRDTIPHIRVVPCSIDLTETTPVPRDVETEWVLFTSGTTGQPKMVLHTLPSLSGPLDDGVAVPDGAVWSTFYDVRRYGGLQMLLRALLGGGSILLTDARQPVATLLERAGAAGVTHISGTPSHWRRALMSPAAHRMAPAYVRLSGEIADQAILDSLREAYPDAGIAHAFASTEAGVAFDVRDGLAGFPAALLDSPGAKAEMRVEDGTLRIRSTRTAARYLDDAAEQLREPGGFVDTGDMVERRGDRCHFIGRRGGVINVGGLKVFPEEVEAVINRHPCVRMSRVWARKSPITGAVVAAEIVLRQAVDDAGPGFPTIRDEIVQACRTALPVHKVPVSLRSVASLEIAASGKLVRHHA